MASDNPAVGYCPCFHQTIELIGRRWTGPIFLAITSGTSRFGEIKNAVPDLSDRLLCERLAELGEAGIIERVVDGRSVSYIASDKGQALREALVGIETWVDVWFDEESPVEHVG